MFITGPANILAPNIARISANTMLIMNLDMISSKHIWCSSDIFHYSHRDCKILSVFLLSKWGHINVLGFQVNWQFCCLFNALLKLVKKRNFTTLCYWLFARVIHHGLLDSPHKRPVMCESFPCDYVIMVWDKCPLHQGASRTHKRQPGNCFKRVFVSQSDN